MSDSYREERVRSVKARQLAAHLDQRGYALTNVQGMHPALREHHARMAGVEAPSEETWTAVVAHLGAMRRERQRMAGKDPFAGL
jgi:hypothetical protein